MSEFEKNRNSLKDALGRMQTYSPADNLWSSLEGKLDEPADEQDDTPLEMAIEKLPGHTPPTQVWNQLNRKLDETQSAQIVRLQQRRRWLIIAASMALVIGAAAWVFREPPPKVTFQYAEETIQRFGVDIDWRLEGDTFAQLEEFMDNTNDPTINKLRVEYEELSSARNDVEEMLRSYGQDPQLVRQMADIERERTDVYRQIIELI